jgi:hypothetical protein
MLVGEYDHRVPFGCHGATNAHNVWPQSSPDFRQKDRLEHWYERQVSLGHMTIEDCAQAFAAPNDWRKRYAVIFPSVQIRVSVAAGE